MHTTQIILSITILLLCATTSRGHEWDMVATDLNHRMDSAEGEIIKANWQMVSKDKDCPCPEAPCICNVGECDCDDCPHHVQPRFGARLKIVSFHASWCDPCQAAEKQARAAGIWDKLTHYDFDRHKKQARLLKVTQIPALVLVKDDRAYKTHVGSAGYADKIQEWIETDWGARTENPESAVYRISGSLGTNRKSYGSAVSVGENLLVTCHHCLANGIKVDVEGTWYPANIVRSSARHDIALIRVKYDGELNTAPLADSPLKVGESVHKVGYPRGGTQRRKLACKATANRYVNPRYSVDAPSITGESGGGVFNSEGALVGIISTTARGTTAGAGVNEIRDLLSRAGRSMAQSQTHRGPGHTHRCGRCGTSWSHENWNVGNPAAHTCPSCGTLTWGNRTEGWRAPPRRSFQPRISIPSGGSICPICPR